jgi:hypothetical protein
MALDLALLRSLMEQIEARDPRSMFRCSLSGEHDDENANQSKGVAEFSARPTRFAEREPLHERCGQPSG